MATRKQTDNEILDLELARAARPQITAYDKPQVERVGLHYEAMFADDLLFKLDHLIEHRDEFNGELTIKFTYKGSISNVLSWGKLNLLSITQRHGLAKQLKEKVEADWTGLIDLFCKEVVRQEREGNPTVTATEHKPTNAHEFLLSPILPVALPTVLYGPGGVGKSTLACGMAYSVETGTEIIKGWKPLSGPVLILDWEGREEDWTERWQQVARGAKADHFPPFHYRACKRRLKDDAEFMAEEIARLGIVLVIVDSVSLAFGTSSYAEADPADMALKAFAAIRELGDVTWLLIDHVTGQMTNDDTVSLKAYGSVKKRDLARQMFHIAGAKESTDDRQELVITHTKSNYSARMGPMGLVIGRQDGALTFTRTAELQAPELVDKLSMTTRIKTLLGTGAITVGDLKTLLGLEPRDQRAQTGFRVSLARLINQGDAVRLPGDRIGLAQVDDRANPDAAAQ